MKAMLFALALPMAVSNADADAFKKRGFEAIEQIRREYYLPESKLYCESIEAGQSKIQSPKSKIRKSGPAFNWPAGVMLSALNAAARLEPKYKTWLREHADATRAYWNANGPVAGYDVLPGPKKRTGADRYYDD